MATKKTALKRWQPYILTQTLMSFVTQIRRSCCVNITKQQMSVTSNSPKTQKERVKMCLWWTNSGMYLQLYMDHVKKHVTMFLSPPPQHFFSNTVQSFACFGVCVPQITFTSRYYLPKITCFVFSNSVLISALLHTRFSVSQCFLQLQCVWPLRDTVDSGNWCEEQNSLCQYKSLQMQISDFALWSLKTRFPIKLQVWDRYEA